MRTTMANPLVNWWHVLRAVLERRIRHRLDPSDDPRRRLDVALRLEALETRAAAKRGPQS